MEAIDGLSSLVLSAAAPGKVRYRHGDHRRGSPAGPPRWDPGDGRFVALRGRFGPNVLGLFGEDRPIASFFAEGSCC